MSFSFIKNLRYGFATNSSSSHSLVYLREPIPGHDSNDSWTWPLNGEFGWADFKLDTLGGKLFYVLVSMVGETGFWAAHEKIVSAANAAFAEYANTFPEFGYATFREAVKGYVDHQSRGRVSLDHARDPHVIVFGGNDNDGASAYRAEVLRSGKVDWTKTMRAHGDDPDVVPPGMRVPCEDCGNPIYDHAWKCPKMPCYGCQRPPGTPHGAGCSVLFDKSKVTLVGQCNYCGVDREALHQSGCFLKGVHSA